MCLAASRIGSDASGVWKKPKTMLAGARTCTVAAALLRDAGAGPVLTFALAVATPRGE